MGKITIKNIEEVVRFEYAATTVVAIGSFTREPNGSVRQINANVTDTQGVNVGNFNGYLSGNSLKYNVNDADSEHLPAIQELITEIETEITSHEEEEVES